MNFHLKDLKEVDIYMDLESILNLENRESETQIIFYFMNFLLKKLKRIILYLKYILKNIVKNKYYNQLN